MANKSLQEALDAVDMTYQELRDIADDMVSPFFQPIDEVINNLGDINRLSNDEIRNFMMTMALKSYSLSEIKEKASLKAELATALRKEEYAKSYSLATGTSGAKDTAAALESSQEVVAECLYELTANMLKSKADSCNRLVDVCKTIIMSRMSEAKLTNVSAE